MQTTFSQFTLALFEKQSSQDSSALIQVLNNQTHISSISGGGGITLGLFSIGGGAGRSDSSSTRTAVDFSTQSSANQFLCVAQQAAQYTDLQRSITISSYEDTETVSTIQRVLGHA